MNIVLLLIIAGVLVTLGDISLAFYARNNTALLLVLGLSVNLVGGIFYSQIMRVIQLGAASALLLGFNVAAISIIGLIYFKDTLTLTKIIAIVSIVISMVLIVQ